MVTNPVEAPRPSSREKILAELRRKLEQPGEDNLQTQAAISTGLKELDAILPHGGLARGTLSEWLSPGPGSGAHAVALFTLLSAARQGRALVICDYFRQWNMAALAGAANLASTPWVVLRPTTLADQWWGAEQALRSPAVGAVWLSCEQIHAREFRRLQLAAEEGQSLGLLLRPARWRSEPSWADVRLLIEPVVPATVGRRLQATLLRCRGGVAGRSVELILGKPPTSFEPQPGRERHPQFTRGEKGAVARSRRA